MTTTPDADTPVPARTSPRADVLFVHIPKTAGMSLHNSMERWFGHEHSLRYPRSTPEFKERYLRLSDADLARFRLLSGHFELPFWLRRGVGDRCIVAVVREPVERILSSYRYMKSWKQHPRHAEVGGMSVAEFIEHHALDTGRHDLQCRKLCGSADFRSALDMARRHVDLLGAVESMDHVTRALEERLGVKLEERADNRSPDQSPTRRDLEPALLAKLETCNREDLKLWDHVMARSLVTGHRDR